MLFRDHAADAADKLGARDLEGAIVYARAATLIKQEG